MVFDTVLTGNQPNLTEAFMENYRKINWALLAKLHPSLSSLKWMMFNESWLSNRNACYNDHRLSCTVGLETYLISSVMTWFMQIKLKRGVRNIMCGTPIRAIRYPETNRLVTNIHYIVTSAEYKTAMSKSTIECLKPFFLKKGWTLRALRMQWRTRWIICILLMGFAMPLVWKYHPSYKSSKNDKDDKGSFVLVIIFLFLLWLPETNVRK